MGSGGIYQLYITAAADNAFAEYVFVHEFGHHMACLADEYYTSSVAYELPSTLTEPYELNVTTHMEPDKIKWAELIDAQTPVPTPWGKDEFDQHSRDIQQQRQGLRAAKTPEKELEYLFRQQLQWEEAYLANLPLAVKTGLYEGAMYRARGVYRSAPACQRTITLVIDQYTK